jgi:outer membrane protein assembly factor BamC
VSRAPVLVLALTLVVAVTAACSRTIVPTKKVDYKSASKAESAPLEVPPDLPKPSTNDRYALPEGPSRSTAT